MKHIRNIRRISSILFALTLLAFQSTQAQEQQADGKPVSKFGIKGGVNLTTLYGDKVSDEHAKVGFNAGLFAKLAVAKGFSIQPELLYTVKGAKQRYDNFVLGSGEYRFNLNYIELPVMAVVNLGKVLNIHAGPYLAYLASADIRDVDNNGSINGASDLNADNFHRWDAGVAAGLGLDFGNFSIGARYNYGLTEIGQSGSLSGQLTSNQKNAAASLYIGIAF